MRPIFYMLEKELIEHKMITRIPLFILACGFLIFIALLTSSLQGNLYYQVKFSGDMNNLNQGLGADFSAFFSYGAGLLSLLLTSLYIPKTLRKERQEGSSMFWRSMPISHEMTLTVKLLFALLVIPAICSILLLTSDILLWVLNLVNDAPSAPLFKAQSIYYILLDWLEFLARMVIVALALLPLAGLTLMVSQLVASPIVVMVIAGYALKWLPVYLFGFYGVSHFLSAILSLPMQALASNPFSGFIEAGAVNLVIYYAIGIAALAMSLTLSKTNEISIKELFLRRAL